MNDDRQETEYLGLVFLDEEFHCDEEAWGTAKPLGLFSGHIGEGQELTADDPALLDPMLGFQMQWKHDPEG